jgi:ferredoxin--NADP+ reductase
MLATDIPDHVYRGLAAKTTTDVHVFARRGPAYAKFSALELRELNHSPNVEVIVHPEGFDVDADGMAHIAKHKAQKMVLNILSNWVGADPVGKPHRIHLHFAEAPVEIVAGTDGRVTTLRTERTHSPNADGTVEGTGEITDWDVQAVYRAIGYRSTPLPGLPFDDRRAVIPNDGGRVLDLDGEAIPGTYVTGWVKRGPVGLIGHTKSDAAETVEHLLAETSITARQREPEDVDAYLAERRIAVATDAAWERIDAHEIALGEAAGRVRIKVAERAEMLRVGEVDQPG